MNAYELMTKDVVSILPDASIVEAAKTMLRNRVSGLPVVDAHGTLVGMITQGDLIHIVLVFPGLTLTKSATDHLLALTRRVAQHMSVQLLTVGQDASIQTVVDIMERCNVRRVPVVDGQRLLGLISRSDLLRAFVREAQRESQADSGVYEPIFPR